MNLSQLIKGLKTSHYQEVERLDKNIYLIDYKYDYNLPGLLEKGVSSIGELMAYAVKQFALKENEIQPLGEADFGCTTFDAFTKDNEHLLARNFDFKSAPCFVVWTHPKNAYASIGVVDANFMTYGNNWHVLNKRKSKQALLAPYCCVDGINEKGLAIAVLQIKAKATKQEDPTKKNITTTAMIRAVLDTCANVDEAVELIKQYNMRDSLYCAYHYQLADRSGRTLVVEYIDSVLHVYEKNSDKYLIDGTEYEGDDVPFTYVANYSITKDVGDFKIDQHGKDRTDAVIQAIKNKNYVLTENEAMDILSHVKLNYDHPSYPWWILALWSAVYNCENSTMKIAANTDFSHVYSFAVDKPCKVLDLENLSNSEYEETEWEYF